MDISVKSLSLNHKNALLLSASRSGDHNLAHFLLDQCKVNPDAREVNIFTPLYEASQNGHAEVAKLLIQYGADVNKVSRAQVVNHYNLLGHDHEEEFSAGNVTPLHIAIINKQPEIANILIENGANVNVDAGYDTGYTPH